MSNPKGVVTIYTHHFEVRTTDVRLRIVCEKFYKTFAVFKLDKKPGQKWKRVLDRHYAVKLRNGTVWRFPIHTLEKFAWEMRDFGIGSDDIEVIKARKYKPAKLTAKVRDKWSPWEEQKPYVEYLAKPDGVRSKLLPMDMGKGKTKTASFAIELIGTRTVIIVLPRYIKKWIGDLKTNFDITDDDITVVQGGDALKALMTKAKNKENLTDFILISNRTFLNYIKEYENSENISKARFTYPVIPIKFWKLIRAGILLIDEVHQHFYGNFLISLYAHVNLFIGLSGTYSKRDKTLSKLYNTLFPPEYWPKPDTINKHVIVKPVCYSHYSPDRMRTTEYGSNLYSHIAYEKSIIKHKPTLGRYLDLVDYCVKKGFLDIRKPYEKLAIYAASVKMCTLITKYLQTLYPSGLSIARYVEQDPYENIIEPDIRVTTIQSGGTAIDIPDLVTVILTHSILSEQSNLQTIGRLRPLKNRPTYFYYTWAIDIPKQKEYHEARIDLLRHRAANIQPLIYPDKI